MASTLIQDVVKRVGLNIEYIHRGRPNMDEAPTAGVLMCTARDSPRPSAFLHIFCAHSYLADTVHWPEGRLAVAVCWAVMIHSR